MWDLVSRQMKRLYLLHDRTHLEPNLPDLLVNVSVGCGDSDVTVVILCGHDIVHLFEVASLKHGDGAVFLVPSLAVRRAGTLVLGVGLVYILRRPLS